MLYDSKQVHRLGNVDLAQNLLTGEGIVLKNRHYIPALVAALLRVVGVTAGLAEN